MLTASLSKSCGTSFSSLVCTSMTLTIMILPCFSSQAILLWRRSTLRLLPLPLLHLSPFDAHPFQIEPHALLVEVVFRSPFCNPFDQLIIEKLIVVTVPRFFFLSSQVQFIHIWSRVTKGSVCSLRVRMLHRRVLELIAKRKTSPRGYKITGSVKKAGTKKSIAPVLPPFV